MVIYPFFIICITGVDSDGGDILHAPALKNNIKVMVNTIIS